MFGIGLPEVVVIIVVGLLVFGPDRLPEFARQAGRMIRQIRVFSQVTRDDIRRELGPQYADLELADLDPRRAARRFVQAAFDEADDGDNTQLPARAGDRILQRAEQPPNDADVT